ncbi:MAG: PEP-CTERM sorting domain-containing protein [Planctomycetales bacterium]|nr:PEP-CTERM sorting domain-containing protein [Planctomycetales bacterium]
MRKTMTRRGALSRLVVGGALFALGLPAARAVDLLSESFDELPLQQVVTFQSETRSRATWTQAVPSGAGVEGTWSIDNSNLPPETASDLIGVAEFEGWSFVDKQWWIDTAGNQGRGEFVSASGVIAVADPDEWDDYGSPDSPTDYGQFDSTLKVSNIPLQGAAPNSVNLFFHSSWRFEGIQKASLTVKYDDPGATEIELFQWDSDTNSPNFKDDATNEAVNIPILNPAGANNASLEFRLFDAGNNWWWAVDNLAMFTGTAPAQDGVLRLIVDRDNGNVQVVNNTSGTVNLRGYSIESTEGTLNESAASYLGDSDSNWQVFDNPDSSELSEGYIPNQYAMPTQTANLTLGVIDLGNAWEKYHEDIDDVTFEYLVAGSDDPVVGIVQFVGNGDSSYDALDLNFDGDISLLDYATFLAGYGSSLDGKTDAQAYNLGDLDRDGKHTVADFLEFKRLFDQLRGPGAFAAALAAGSQVPEPSTLASLAVLLAGVAVVRVRRFAGAALLIALAIGGWASSANAALPLLVEDFESVPLGQSPEEQPTQFGVWSGDGPAGWTIDRSGMPGIGDPDTDGVTDWAGWAVAKKDWWVVVAGDQDRSQFSRGVGAVLVADPDEWDDADHPDGKFSTYITSPVINIPAGVPAGKIKVAFDSSWRPEGFDDGDLTNNQTATLDVSYNSAPFSNLLTWDSQEGGPNFHTDETNEAVELDANYNGSSTSIQLRFGLNNAINDWWWALDNVRVFVPSDPAVLRVDTTTGYAKIVGGDVITETINGYDVASAGGNLNPVGNLGLSYLQVDPIDGPDADSAAGSTLGENWQLAAETDNLFSEFFLDGSSDFTSSRTESLGRIFDPATAELDRDLTFTYTTVFGDIVEGVVEYFASTGGTADFDVSGQVNGGDFLAWQRGYGSGSTFAQGDADGDSDVDGADLAVWQSRFGLPSAAATLAPVPEPGSVALALIMLGGAALRDRRRFCNAAWGLATLIVFVAMAASAGAQVIPPPTVDRNYRLGDGDPSATNGATVSVTRDDAGAAGMNQLIDMTAATKAGGAPKYVTVTGRPDGVGGLGIQLNANPTDKQYLRTAADEALNFPERSPSSTEGTLPGGTIDYSYITDRGFQLWVKPYAATESFIVMDSNNHGALIDAEGKFGMRYANFDYSGVTTVVPDQWYHLMVVRAWGDRGTGSVLYVDGVAEAAATGIYNGEDAPNDEMNPANHDNSPLVVGSSTSESPFQIGTQKYFHGVVDDLTMFVMGLNATNDFGEFEFGRDNAYAAHFGPTTAGDLNGDDQITMADVTLFASNWLYEKKLTWTQGEDERSLVVGDLESRSRGDFNYDGRVDLADWGILNTANPAMAAAAMSLINSVPEPGSCVLAGVAVAALLACRRRARG